MPQVERSRRASRCGCGPCQGGARSAGVRVCCDGRAGGSGTARVVALSYYSLGTEHTETSLANLRSYYGFLGDWAEGMAAGIPRTPEAIRQVATAFEALGVDELVFDPTVPDLDQIDRLAEVVPPG